MRPRGLSDGVAAGNVHVRRGVAFTLHRIAHHPFPAIDRELLLEAIKLLDDKDANVKMHAVMAVSTAVSIFPERVKPHLHRILAFLDEKDWKLRMCTSIALGNLAQYCQEDVRAQVLPKLVPLLEDRDPRITSATALSVGKMV